MIIVYLVRMAGEDADISYNTAWAGMCAFAENSLGITVTGTFLLPKFIEAEGTKLRGVFNSLTRPFTSLTSGGSFGILTQSKKGTATTREVTLDTVTIMGHSESDLSSTNRDRDLDRYSSYEGDHNLASYPSVNATDTPHRL